MWSPANAGTLLRATYVKTVAMRIVSISPHRSHTFAAGPPRRCRGNVRRPARAGARRFLNRAAGVVSIRKASPKASRLLDAAAPLQVDLPKRGIIGRVGCDYP